MKSMKLPAAAVLLLTAVLWPLAAQDSGTPNVSLDNQAVTDGKVVVARVVSSGPGWIVIHTQADGKPGPVIGCSAVRSGVNCARATREWGREGPRPGSCRFCDPPEGLLLPPALPRALDSAPPIPYHTFNHPCTEKGE
jgi:hypothetical protein